MSKGVRLPNGFFRDSSVRIGYVYAVDFQIAQAVVYVNTRNGLALPHIDGFERSPGAYFEAVLGNAQAQRLLSS